MNKFDARDRRKLILFAILTVLMIAFIWGNSCFSRAMSGAGKSYGGYGAGARAVPFGGVKPATGGAPDFRKGDTVRHKAFGRGMVLSVQKMGGDALVEIAFDDVGTKRLMLKSAAAHMEKV